MIKKSKNGGFAGVDIVIALGIISITLLILAAMYINTYIANVEIERRTQAINYATQIFEKISEYYYGDITNEKFAVTTNVYGNKEVVGIEIPEGYTVNIDIENYKTEEALDVVKNINIQVSYKVGEKNNTLVLSKYKTKENIVTPNRPELAQNMVAVKVQKTGNTASYKTTSMADSDWYNYYGRKWALAKETTSGTTITAADLYVWIPRYAYRVNNNGTIDIEFLYSNKNQKVGAYGSLENISFEYSVDNTFAEENARGYWIKVSEIKNDETAKRLNNSEYGPLIY